MAVEEGVLLAEQVYTAGTQTSPDVCLDERTRSFRVNIHSTEDLTALVDVFIGSAYRLGVDSVAVLANDPVVWNFPNIHFKKCRFRFVNALDATIAVDIDRDLV